MPRQPKKLAWWIRAIAVALAIVLVALGVFLVLQYRALRREAALNAHEWRWSLFLGHRAPLPPADAGVIRSWMTFDYVNKIFDLPPAYLKSTLRVADPGYPRLTVAAYGADAGLDAAAALDAVQKAVFNYAPTATTTTVPRAGATGTTNSI